MNFAVNVLGTYTMTELMLPLLEKAAPDARVITVASGGMYTSPLTEDLQVTWPNLATVYVANEARPPGSLNRVYLRSSTTRNSTESNNMPGTNECRWRWQKNGQRRTRTRASGSTQCTRGGQRRPESPRVCPISQKCKLVFPSNPPITQSKRDILPCLGLST